MNYLLIGQERDNSVDSWPKKLVVSSKKELTHTELNRIFYLKCVYKFSEDADDTEDWDEDDHIEFFEENDGDAFVDYILKTEESIPTLEMTDFLVSHGGG